MACILHELFCVLFLDSKHFPRVFFSQLLIKVRGRYLLTIPPFLFYSFNVFDFLLIYSLPELP